MSFLYNLLLFVLTYLGAITFCYLIWQIGRRLGFENNKSDEPPYNKQ